MVSLKIDPGQVSRLKAALGGVSKKLKKELAIAVNATAKKTRLDMGRDIRKELSVPKKTVEEQLKIKGKATAANPQVRIILGKSGRIPLRDFGARKTNKGVSYKTSPKGGRKVVVSAFQVRKWRGRVFRRIGKPRLPIIQLFGASPWGAFVKNNRLAPTVRDAKAELRKQIERRIKFQVLKAAGKLRGKQAG